MSYLHENIGIARRIPKNHKIFNHLGAIHHNISDDYRYHPERFYCAHRMKMCNSASPASSKRSRRRLRKAMKGDSDLEQPPRQTPSPSFLAALSNLQALARQCEDDGCDSCEKDNVTEVRISPSWFEYVDSEDKGPFMSAMEDDDSEHDSVANLISDGDTSLSSKSASRSRSSRRLSFTSPGSRRNRSSSLSRRSFNQKHSVSRWESSGGSHFPDENVVTSRWAASSNPGKDVPCLFRKPSAKGCRRHKKGTMIRMREGLLAKQRWLA